MGHYYFFVLEQREKHDFHVNGLHYVIYLAKTLNDKHGLIK